jgi:poly(3-hydroxybutyrate) depolymerase
MTLTRQLAPTVLLSFTIALGCADSGTSPTGAAGTNGAAGAIGGAGTNGAAGTMAATAGTNGAAGTSASGAAGTSATGAAGTSATGTAGTSASGAAGTSASGTAGTSATAGRGGNSAGTTGSGGRGGRGGTTSAAGTSGSAAGTSGSAAGTTGTAGATGTGGATASTGCGKTPPASARYTIPVGSMTREYILSVPSNYNPNTPYRLIFGWHPWGGSAQQVAGTGNSGYYGLKGASNNQAILVSPEGLDFGGNGLGWGNSNGQDIAFLRAMLERFKAEMCIDESRIFSTGFSFGGMMSNAVACSGLARAVAPMAGNATSGCVSGTTRVAYMGFHGDDDTVVSIASGRSSRDTIVQRNGCTTQTMPVSPSWCDGLSANNMPCNCVSYQGCAAGYPVIWCEFNGPHTPAPNSAATLWTFFSQF